MDSIVQIPCADVERLLRCSEKVTGRKNRRLVAFVAIGIKSVAPAVNVEVTQPAEMCRTLTVKEYVFLTSCVLAKKISTLLSKTNRAVHSAGFASLQGSWA